MIPFFKLILMHIIIKITHLYSNIKILVISKYYFQEIIYGINGIHKFRDTELQSQTSNRNT